MKIGICVNLCDVDRAINMGYDFIDLNGQELASMPLNEVRDLARRLKSSNVPCVGLHATLPPSIQLVGAGFREGAVVEYFSMLAKRADALDVNYIGIGSPASRRLAEGYDVKLADGQMRLSIQAATRAYPRGMVLLESLNGLETNYINTVSHAYQIIKDLPAESAGLVLDVYHFVLSGQSEESFTADLASRVKYIHIADPNGRRFPSRDTDKGLLRFAIEAALMANADKIAVEAVTDDLDNDGKKALDVLRRWM